MLGKSHCSSRGTRTPYVKLLFLFCPILSRRSDLCHGDPVQDHLLFKKTLLPVWKMIASHRFSSPFLKPVSERQAPGYKDVVKRSVEKGSRKVGCFYICLFILYFASVRLFPYFIYIT